MGVWRSKESPPSPGPVSLDNRGGQQYHVPYSKFPMSLGEELQLSSGGGDTGGCAPGCQAGLPPANKATLSKPASRTPSSAQRGPEDMIPSCLRPLCRLSQTGDQC